MPTRPLTALPRGGWQAEGIQRPEADTAMHPHYGRMINDPDLLAMLNVAIPPGPVAQSEDSASVVVDGVIMQSSSGL